MIEYKYKAIGPSGKVKKGKLYADSIEDARDYLKNDLYRPIKITKMSAVSRDIKIFKSKKVSTKDMSTYLHQFSTIYQTGIPIVSTLELVRKQTSNKILMVATYNVIKSLEEGKSLYVSLKQEEGIFPSILCNMISVGEKTGNLVDILKGLSMYYEKLDAVRNATIKAMIYPCIVMIVVLGALGVMITQVIPKFEKIFAMADNKLPLITQIVMGGSSFVLENFIIISIVLLGIVIGTILFSKTTRGKYFYGLLARKIPIVKIFTQNQASAMFANTLFILTSAGIPILDSLEIVSVSLKNVYYRDAVIQAKELVTKGNPLAVSLSSMEVFPELLCQMVSIGESSGKLTSMLKKASVCYDNEADIATQRLLAAMEPAIMVLLCIVVGVIVFAIALPMFSLYGNIL